MGVFSPFIVLSLCASVALAAAPKANLNISALTADIESDTTSVYYYKRALLLGNDGTAATGGFRAWELDGSTPLKEVKKLTPGRSKLIVPVYDLNGKGKDYAISITAPTSILSVYELPDFDEVKDARFKALGDWSCLSAWRSKSGNQYFYLFGKKQIKQFLIRRHKRDVEILEVNKFPSNPTQALHASILPLHCA
jgi:3-phytase